MCRETTRDLFSERETGMQAEDAAGFGHAFGMLVGAVTGRDDFFGGLVLQVGTPVGDNTIA